MQSCPVSETALVSDPVYQGPQRNPRPPYTWILPIPQLAWSVNVAATPNPPTKQDKKKA
jgi:hypothetical protein